VSSLGPHWEKRRRGTGSSSRDQLGKHLARAGPPPGETLGPVLETNWGEQLGTNGEALGTPGISTGGARTSAGHSARRWEQRQRRTWSSGKHLEQHWASTGPAVANLGC
jgi:hypothetical protein